MAISKRSKRNCFAEFILSVAEGLAMTVRRNERPCGERQSIGSKGLLILDECSKLVRSKSPSVPLLKRGIYEDLPNYLLEAPNGIYVLVHRLQAGATSFHGYPNRSQRFPGF